MLRYTAWGRHVYAVGDDAESARLAGIQVQRVLLSVYVVAGVIFAIAGWILIGRVNAASPNSGIDANLDSITAVVIGGTSLFGGRGTVIGSADRRPHRRRRSATGCSLAGLDPNYQTLAIGILDHHRRLRRPVDSEGSRMTAVSEQTSSPAQTAQPVLQAKAIVKTYGHVVALDGVDFELYPARCWP